MSIDKKIVSSVKWSGIGEILYKLIVPITNMILARILIPGDFGVVASITMVISFADIFTDAGFQKYIIQHQFDSTEEEEKYINVAFWTNLVISMFIWFAIIIFSKSIAIILGDGGLSIVLVTAAIQLPMTSFSSIQMTIYKKRLDFKILFKARLISMIIPFMVTIPLAVLGFRYWAIIIAGIITQMGNAIFLTVKSKWLPKKAYSFTILKRMFSFSIWSLVEAISIWLTVWIDTFIVGIYLTSYELGLYKTSTSMVNSMMAIITATVLPVLFSGLAKLKEEEENFQKLFYTFQKYIGYIVFPIAGFIFLYSDLITIILLGKKWSASSYIVGIWSVTLVFSIVFSNLNSEVYRAKGKPKLSFFLQIVHLIFIIIISIAGLEKDFETFIYFRSFIRFQSIILGFFVMRNLMHFSLMKICKNTILPIIISSILVGIGLSIAESEILKNLYMVLYFVLYGIIIFLSNKKDFDVGKIKSLVKESGGQK